MPLFGVLALPFLLLAVHERVERELAGHDALNQRLLALHPVVRVGLLGGLLLVLQRRSLLQNPVQRQPCLLILPLRILPQDLFDRNELFCRNVNGSSAHPSFLILQYFFIFLFGVYD